MRSLLLALPAAWLLLSLAPPGVAAVPPAAPGPAPSAAARAGEATRTIHLLEYIAVDYPEAVEGGRVVNPLEYQEQVEFVGQVGERLQHLGLSGELGAELEALRRAVAERRSEAEVERLARALAAGIRARFPVARPPERPPSLERGRALYESRCASCHGAEGRGDGPAGAGLDPPPADFTRRDRAFSMSPFALYSTIRFGIEGTGMPGFGSELDEGELLDLTFYVGSLAFTPEERERGQALAGERPELLTRRVPDWATLFHQPVARLADADPEALALVAHARTQPGAVLGAGAGPIDRALRELDASWSLYRQGDARRALDHAIAAYLDGFEPVEPALDAVDSELRVAIETGFLRYRKGLRDGQDAETLARLHGALRGQLLEARARLEAGGLGPAALFASAIAILLREGLEAILILVAIGALLSRAGRREAMPYFHAGWAAALLAGGLTWVAARGLVELSGARREAIEGITSLLAMGILFYVSYWLLARVQASRWQGFVDGRLRQALSRGSLLGIASITFVAVYRELFETVLFFEALKAQAAPGTGDALLAGAATGALGLAALGLGMLRFGLRIPLRQFFLVSSALLYLLAFVLAGQGVAALQEAGWLPATPLPGPRFEWLGIHPTAEGLALQGLLLLAALLALPWSLRRSLRHPAAVALLVTLGLGAGPGCGPKVVRESVVQTPALSVVLRERVVEPETSGPGYAHPATISAVRLAAILSRIDVRTKEGDPRRTEPAIPTEILFEVAEGISHALERATPRQEVVVMARRRERRLGLFTREYLTSLVTFVRGERLEVHLGHLDWPIPGDPDTELREPWVGQRVMAFRVVPREGIEPIGPQSVAAVWRDPLFQSARDVQRGPGGKIRRRTILLESPEEAGP